jgi:hypothetical protein
MPAAITYVLGKDCKLFIESEEIKGVADVSVRETTTEIDATGFNSFSGSTAIVGRTIEILLSVPDRTVAKKLLDMRWKWRKAGTASFYLQQIVDVELQGGLFDIIESFTIHEIDGDELLDGAVIPRFALRQWKNSTDDNPPIPTGPTGATGTTGT